MIQSYRTRTLVIMSFLILVIVISSTNVFAAQENTNVPVDDGLISAIEQAVIEFTQGDPNGLLLSPQDIEVSGQWAFARAVVNANSEAVGGSPLIILVLAHFVDHQWLAAVETTPQFQEWLPLVDSTLVDDTAKSFLTQSSLQSVGLINLSLPWTVGETWGFSGGPHDLRAPDRKRGPYTANSSALDFLPNPKTGTHSDVVRAAADGVAYITSSCPALVRIDHENGWQTRYHHLRQIDVANGQRLSRGDQVGLAGGYDCYNNATAFGKHLDFSILNGANIWTSGLDIDGFVIGGWRLAKTSGQYNGTLTRLRDGLVRTANELEVESRDILNEGVVGSGANSAFVQISVDLPHLSGNAWVLDLRVVLSRRDTGVVMYDQSDITLFGMKHFTLAGIPPDDYRIWVKGSNTLSVATERRLVAGASNSFHVGELRPGDVNGDDFVDISDYSVLVSSFFKFVGEVGYNEQANINQDDLVDITDYSLMVARFFQTGAPQVSSLSALSASDQAIVTAAVGSVNLHTLPSTAAVTVGDEFDMTLQAVAGVQPIVGVQTFLNFDPSKLQVVSITPGTALSANAFINRYNNTTGEIDYVQLVGLNAPPVSGTFTIATVRLRAISAMRGSPIVFNTRIPRQTKVAYEGENVTGALEGGLIIIAAPPPNGAPSLDYYTTGTPTLTWGQVTWAVGYEIEVARNANFADIVYAHVGGVPEITLPFALEDGVYYWRVRAVDASNNVGTWSAIMAFTVDKP